MVDINALMDTMEFEEKTYARIVNNSIRAIVSGFLPENNGAACLCTITDYSEHADAESRKALPEKSAGDVAAIYGNTGSKKQTAGRSSGSGRKRQYGKKQFFVQDESRYPYSVEWQRWPVENR